MGIVNASSMDLIVLNLDSDKASYTSGAYPSYVNDFLKSDGNQNISGAMHYIAVATNNYGEPVFGNNAGPGSFDMEDVIKVVKNKESLNTMIDQSPVFKKMYESFGSVFNKMALLDCNKKRTIAQSFFGPVLAYVKGVSRAVDGYSKYSVILLEKF